MSNVKVHLNFSLSVVEFGGTQNTRFLGRKFKQKSLFALKMNHPIKKSGAFFGLKIQMNFFGHFLLT